MADLRFDDQTVVVTGAAGGLGKAYALFFASRGANVVVNDLGCSLNGAGSSKKPADDVVNEIKKAGGKAVASYDSVENGERIIETAIQAFGRIDILLNNAGNLRDAPFDKMSDEDFESVIQVHVTGAYRCARAAWPYFRKQKRGSVINTSSGAGLVGSGGRCNYSAAKSALIGFTETLAKEGYKYNIICNAIAPFVDSRMVTSIGVPTEILDFVNPDPVVALVAVLVHPSNKSETGGTFEVGGRHVAKLRWERAKGALLKTDSSLTPSAVLRKWDQVSDFSEPEHPIGPADFVTFLEEAAKMGSNEQGENVSLKGRVALITGAGGGLGRSYALLFAKLGASVVVNDLMNPETTVQEIEKLGGKAVGNKASAEDGDFVVKSAIDAFGRIDILVNNAGILRDKAFNNMDDKLWNDVMGVHLRGTFKTSRAAYPYMLKQKYGRILNTTSTSGIYGNFGQANYAAAKMGILGLSRALAQEGAEHNIFVNTIAPNAGTNMTRSVMPEEMVQAFKPDYVAPLVALLCSENIPAPSTGNLYEVGSGWIGRTRWQRTGGHKFPSGVELTPENMQKAWKDIVNFDDGRADYPVSLEDALKNILSSRSGTDAPSSQEPDILSNIEAAKKMSPEATKFNYDDKDVILYNLSLGAKRTDLPLVYEGSEDFSALPTFGVVPYFSASPAYAIDEIVPNFNPMMLLHGEQYLEIRKFPILTAAETVSYPRLIEVIDKGNAAVIVSGTVTKDARSGDELFYNEMTVFVRGSGGFGGPKRGSSRGAATAVYKPPQRAPDAVVEEKTTEDQAALYRLNGDRNPLHIDPEFSAVGGFKIPILHGLCFFGISGKHVLQKYGIFKNIKVRFAGTVIPGQTLQTEMWQVEGGKVVFQTRVKETGKLCIAGAGVELVGEVKAKL